MRRYVSISVTLCIISMVVLAGIYYLVCGNLGASVLAGVLTSSVCYVISDIENGNPALTDDDVIDADWESIPGHGREVARE